jgi:hypothetical protein
LEAVVQQEQVEAQTEALVAILYLALLHLLVVAAVVEQLMQVV